jgi:hypothetical protein
MEAYLTWLQGLPLSVWISESDSVWGYPFVLFMHTIGIALTAGCGAVILMRMMGVARSFPIIALRKLLPFFWTGLILNAISGTLLFSAAATSTGYRPVYYAKLILLLFAILTLMPVRSFIASDEAFSGGAIPSRIKGMAALSLVLWASVITTGRLIAYLR